MRIIITNESVYEWAAYYTTKCILDYSNKDKPFVLSFPIRYIDKSYYQKLLSFYNDNIVSFKNVHIVSSGEYIDSNISQKYIENNFLQFIDLPKENIHLFDSFVLDRKKEAKRMKDLIKNLGGITLLIDSLAEDGSFLLNTPSSSLEGSVRDKRVSEIIRSYEAKKIGIASESFPKEGFTLGFEEAFDSKYIMIIAKGYEVSEALPHCVEGEISQFYPTSILQKHKKLIIVADEEASENLKVKTYKYAKSLESKSLHPKELIKGLYKSYYALTNIKIFDGEKFIKGYCIVIENNIIKSVEKEIDVDAVITRIDLGGKIVAPGYIDLQINGIGGYDINAYPSLETLQNMSEVCQQYGCTSFLPTIITNDDNHMIKVIDLFNSIEDLSIFGVLGIHFEGPYLDMKWKGAQPPEAIVSPSVEEFKEYQEAADNLIKIITMAPEHDPEFALTRYASQHGTIVSIGHSNATFQEAMMAVANGASSVTHTYNAQTPFTHRANGIVGLAFRLHDMYSEVICDCNHSTPEALNIFFKEKNNKAIMISDALMCKGFEPGTEFLFGGHPIVIYPDGSAHLKEEGNLAGSTLKINEGLKNLVEKALVPFDMALNSCTINPATLLRVDDHLGKISAGYDASIVVLEDNYEVKATYVEGKEVYSR